MKKKKIESVGGRSQVNLKKQDKFDQTRTQGKDGKKNPVLNTKYDISYRFYDCKSGVITEK